MNTYYVAGIPFNGDNSLQHYGVKGQKWGERRYQNEDGSYTTAGRIHYGINGIKNAFSNGINFITGNRARAQIKKADSIPEKKYYTGLINNFRQASSENRQTVSKLREEASKPISPYNTKGFKEQSKRLDDIRRTENYQKNRINSNLSSMERECNSFSMHRSLANMQAQRAYDATLPGKINNFTQSAAKVIDEKYNEVVDWLEENAEKAKNSAKKATSVIKEAGSKAVSDLKNTASKASKNVANFFTKLFG